LSGVSAPTPVRTAVPPTPVRTAAIDLVARSSDGEAMMTMRWMLTVALVAAGCGSSSSNECTMDVNSMTPDNAGHVSLTGNFASAQPLLNLQSMDGMHHIVVCVTGADASTADCDLSGIAPGTYTVAFQESCLDDTQDPGDVGIAGGVPATLTVD